MNFICMLFLSYVYDLITIRIYICIFPNKNVTISKNHVWIPSLYEPEHGLTLFPKFIFCDCQKQDKFCFVKRHLYSLQPLWSRVLQVVRRNLPMASFISSATFCDVIVCVATENTIRHLPVTFSCNTHTHTWVSYPVLLPCWSINLLHSI